nr:IclR family transcriptional regulator [Shinella pollutisoli]
MRTAVGTSGTRDDRVKKQDDLPEQSASDSPRSAERLMIILDALSRASTQGLRLADLVEATSLGKTTAHRLVNGLCDHGLVDFDPETARYFVGIKLLSFASAARNRFSVAKLSEPSLSRLVRKTQDTIYLIGRSGDHAVCLDAREGAFPIRVLTLNIGDRRPLGVGAGSLAMLAAMTDAEIERVLVQQKMERSRFAFSDDQIRSMIAATREQGYSYNDTHIYKEMADITGMAAIAVALRRSDGQPAGAIHLTAITQRVAAPRRESLVEMLRTEARRLEEEIQPVLDAPMLQGRP